jgi:serine/threonine protein kinase
MDSLLRVTGRRGLREGGGVLDVYGAQPKNLWQMTAQTGSYAYMPPEVFRGHPYNAKVDVYAVALIIYQLFAQVQKCRCMDHLHPLH